MVFKNLNLVTVGDRKSVGLFQDSKSIGWSFDQFLNSNNGGGGKKRYLEILENYYTQIHRVRQKKNH